MTWRRTPRYPPPRNNVDAKAPRVRAPLGAIRAIERWLRAERRAEIEPCAPVAALDVARNGPGRSGLRWLLPVTRRRLGIEGTAPFSAQIVDALPAPLWKALILRAWDLGYFLTVSQEAVHFNKRGDIR